MLFGKVVYLSLFCVGILFIYRGDIVQRFKTGRTNFAQYSENMTEMPTVVTGLLYTPLDVTVGKDFNISTNLYDDSEDDLTFGQNRVKGNTIEVNIESFLFSINVTSAHPALVIKSHRFEKMSEGLWENSGATGPG